MSDHIVLSGMRFDGRHGVSSDERELPQPIEVDIELGLDLRPAGEADNLAATVDYGPVAELCRAVVEERSFRLLEAIAENLAAELIRQTPAESVTVRVRKLAVPMELDLDHAGVEITRTRRSATDQPGESPASRESPESRPHATR